MFKFAFLKKQKLKANSNLLFITDRMVVLVVGRPSQEDIVWPTHILWSRSIIGRETHWSLLVTAGHTPLPEILLVPAERVSPRVVVAQLEEPDQPPGLYHHPQQALPYQQQHYQPEQIQALWEHSASFYRFIWNKMLLLFHPDLK